MLVDCPFYIYLSDAMSCKIQIMLTQSGAPIILNPSNPIIWEVLLAY